MRNFAAHAFFFDYASQVAFVHLRKLPETTVLEELTKNRPLRTVYDEFTQQSFQIVVSGSVSSSLVASAEVGRLWV